MLLPSLCAIVDVDAAARAGWPAVDLARAFLDGGARFLQIRAKQLASGALLELCDAIVSLARPVGGIVIVNDRVDLARLSDAAGVHVGQDDLPPSLARAQLGDAAVIGYSTHTTAQLEASRVEPATYTAVGPIFGSVTKETGYDAVGLDLVTAAVRIVAGRPVVAIGGITLENAPSVIAAGAASVAVIGDLLRGGAPDARVRAFLRVLS
ncbi:MAG TPA: thiamine phosphate synthase [Vicinamibacterales bacterium]|nr:thiamine phosphate synthase [Vicinamibacterales bacterium]